ncbi:hypothetical protein NA56DRAFT_691473 [Hyaloscypha hepaticicola]|uniref:MARVEL domain-containing protein n=1 Tax=Hyaloscypha hepaticicola TaxID=2082293 RepID=A0A2J6PVM2_9HELO|nr:hypothetical protein NA56DRAFT_691473 [Hyaloscypha hepaticicola]
MAYNSVTGNSKLFRSVLVLSRFMQWASAAIVMGIVSYYINHYPKGEHIIYEEVIACTTLGFFLLPLALSFTKKTTWYIVPLDLIFSYLWLTAFIFEAEDYNWQSCSANAPSGAGSCSLKYASESFTFCAFFFTLLSMVIQMMAWISEEGVARDIHDKKADFARPSAETRITEGNSAV